MTNQSDIGIAEGYIAEARFELEDATRKAQSYLDSAERLLRAVKAEMEADETIRRTHV